MPVRTNAHHTQLPATPLRRTMSVTRLGVSLLKVGATIDRPASHQGTGRPEAKNSEVLLPARLPKNSAGAKQMTRHTAAMNQSTGARCMATADYTGPRYPGATRETLEPGRTAD